MALPSAGNPISLQQVNVELDLTATATINMGGSNVRTLFDVSSGAIDMSDGYGKSNNVAVTASAASSANLKTLFDNASSGSWADNIAKVYTINSGTTMGILTAPTSMGGTLVINNSGNIQGTAGSAGSSGAGGAAGDAMTVQSTGITINMLSGSTLSGGGGGGGKGGTGGNGTRYQCAGSSAGNCQNAGGCAGDESSFYMPTSGGTGGAGGIGQGYGQSQANGSAGSEGSQHSGQEQANAGDGGTGGNGGSYCGTNGSSGSSGGAAGRAVTFSGVSAYTIIGTNSGTINGAYT